MVMVMVNEANGDDSSLHSHVSSDRLSRRISRLQGMITVEAWLVTTGACADGRRRRNGKEDVASYM